MGDLGRRPGGIHVVPCRTDQEMSREDVHRLQTTLYELGECRKLLDAAIAET